MHSVMEVMKNKPEQQQTRNVIHTELCSRIERERDEKERTQNYVVHLEKGYIHGRENKKLFYYCCSIQMEAYI